MYFCYGKECRVRYLRRYYCFRHKNTRLVAYVVKNRKCRFLLLYSSFICEAD